MAKAVRCVAWLLVLSLAGGGCVSSRKGGGLNKRLIRPATHQKAEARTPPPADSFESVIAKIRALGARARPAPRHITGQTIEGADPRLAAALLALDTWPGAASHRQVGQEYARLGILDAAHRHFQAAVRLDPRDAGSHDGLARIWRDWGLPALGLGDARRAVYHAPGSPEAQNTLGTILQALGQQEGARTAYRQAVTLEPRAAYALNNLGYLALLEGRATEAVTYFDRAREADPGLAAARHNLALAYAASGRLDRARHMLQAADSPAVADYNIGIIHLSQQDRVAARAAFGAACRAGAGVKWACERYTQLSATLDGTEGTP